MPINLVVEDGTGVADANSYVDLSYARDYALSRGVTLSNDDEVLKAQLIKGFDYIESKNCDYQGFPVYDTAFPREGIKINCKEFPKDQIPKQAKDAQVQLAMATEAGIEIFPNVSTGDYVISEKIGPMEFKYSDPSKIGLGDMSPTMTAVDVLLKVLMQTCSEASFTLRSRRV